MRTTLSTLACAALVCAGCATTEPIQSSKTEILSGHTDFPPDLGRGAPRTEIMSTLVFVPTEVEQVCAGLDPKFEVDSARLEAEDNRSLRVLAECMTSGPLRGRSLRLIGHADVRGSIPLNDRLAKQRAESVRLFLMKAGISADRLLTETHGKDGATPPPADWDRRVDFEIVTP